MPREPIVSQASMSTFYKNARFCFPGFALPLLTARDIRVVGQSMRRVVPATHQS